MVVIDFDEATKIKNWFSKESFEQIKQNPNYFSQNQRDLFAKGQEVVFLFSQTEAQLIAHLRKDGNKIVAYLNQRERDRLNATLFKTAQSHEMKAKLKENLQADIKIPYGYQFVMSEPDFIWMRYVSAYEDKDIYIARKKYTSPEQFQKDSLVAFRDAVCKKYLFEDPERPDTYLVTETTISFKPVIAREVNFNNKFAVNIRGLWKTNNLTMGGPFVGYAMADPTTGMLYYIEGFTISPGRSQREIIRELETILSTFRTPSELALAKLK